VRRLDEHEAETSPSSSVFGHATHPLLLRNDQRPASRVLRHTRCTPRAGPVYQGKIKRGKEPARAAPDRSEAHTMLTLYFAPGLQLSP
jgi:hypothetical protein